VAVGVAREVKDHDSMDWALDGAPDLWDPRAGSHVIAILPALLSGRRFLSAA
jgi:hypothetical protein